MQPGEDVKMYGVLVGKAQSFIPVGGLMTTENIKHAADDYSYRNVQQHWIQPDISKFINKTFNGYKRSDGRVGTANYWLFIPTVFCWYSIVNSICIYQGCVMPVEILEQSLIYLFFVEAY